MRILRAIVGLAALLGGCNGWGQTPNLVPNPGFETYRTCPPYPGQIHLAVPWDSPNNKTTDFFHRCAGLENNAGVPKNLLGSQEPHSGDGYIGLRAWIPVIAGNPPYREYATTPLRAPLDAGRMYAVRFWLSVAERSSFVSDGLGLFFSHQKPAPDSAYVLQPHLAYTDGQLLEDDDAWVSVSGIYQADGGEQYLTIGNFRPDSTTLRKERLQDQPTIYYYLDDVSVRACPTQIPVLPLLDTFLCTGESMLLRVDESAWSVTWSDGRTGWEKWVDQPGRYIATLDYGCYQVEQEVIVGERPCGCALPDGLVVRPGQVNWSVPTDIRDLSLRLFDVRGRLLGRYRDAQSVMVAAGQLPAGLYFFRAEFSCLSTGNRLQSGRVIVVTY